MYTYRYLELINVSLIHTQQQCPDLKLNPSLGHSQVREQFREAFFVKVDVGHHGGSRCLFFIGKQVGAVVVVVGMLGGGEEVAAGGEELGDNFGAAGGSWQLAAAAWQKAAGTTAVISAMAVHNPAHPRS